MFVWMQLFEEQEVWFSIMPKTDEEIEYDEDRAGNRNSGRVFTIKR